MINGNKINIRPVLAGEIEQFVAKKNASVLSDDYMLPIIESPQAILNEFLINGLITDEFETYLIADYQDRMVGSIHAFCPSIYRATREMGLIIFDSEDRCQGFGREALKLLVNYLFMRENINRVQMCIPVDNIASRKIAESAGLSLEGIAKKLVHLKTGFHDCAVYALTK